MDTSAVVEAFVQAWNEADVTTRRQLLGQTWADDGVYADPDGTIEGRDALLADIAQFRQRGTRVELTSGIDVGQLADDGRIASITAFYGPLQ